MSGSLILTSSRAPEQWHALFKDDLMASAAMAGSFTTPM